MTVYSASRLSTALDCQYKYYQRYHLKNYPDTEMSYFLVGRVVHQIIEDFYRSRICSAVFSSEKQVEWCVEQLNKSFRSKFGQEVMNALTTYFDSYNDAVAKVKKETGATSRPTTTNLWKKSYESTYESYRDWVDELAIKADDKITFKKGLCELYEQSRKCLVNFVDIHSKAPSNPRAVIHEFRLDPAIEVFGIEKGGRVDRIDMKVSDGGAITYSVYDYKTGKQYWNENSVRTNSQLLWYSYGLKETHGVYPERIGIWDLFHNKLISVKFDEGFLKEFLTNLKSQVNTINELEAKFELPEQEIDFLTPSESWKCKSCEYNPICPYKENA